MSAVIGRTRIDLRDPPRGEDYLQLAITLVDGTVLGQNLFRLSSFKGQEQVSSPFEFQLQLHANTNPGSKIQLDFDQIVGRPVSFALRRPSANPTLFAQAFTKGEDEGWSFFNGIAASFSQAEPGVYNLSVKAALWKLSLSNGYRLHPQCNIRDAIAKMLDRHKVAYDMSALAEGDNPATWRIQDWLQAGESDLAFVQRLMGKGQLYFYFRHSAQGHTTVFANTPYYGKVYDDGRPLRFTQANIEALGLDQDDLITQYSYEQTLTASTVQGRFVQQHNIWRNSPNEFYPPGYNTFHASKPDGDDALPFHQLKVHQYGCNQEEVTRFTTNAADALATSGTSLSGGSSCDRMRVGHIFSLTGSDIAPSHPDPVRPNLEGRSFVLTQVQHQANLDGKYSNQFQSTEDTGLVTPFDIQDTHQGSMLAEVLAHSSVDGSGRWEYDYKTNFDLAQHTFEDTLSGDNLDAKGVFVRFCTDDGGEPLFVKLAPHMQTIPEVGAIVLVGRSSDDSELPEIQQTLHSFGSKTITPPGWTSNTSVGNNDSTSYGDSRSLRYGQKSNIGTGDVDAAWGKVEGAYKSGKFKDAGYSQGASWSYSTSENGRHAILNEGYSYGNTYNHSEADESKSWSDTGYSYREETTLTSESISTTGTETRTSTTGTSTNTQTTGTSTNTSLTGMSSNSSVTGMHSETSATGMSTSTSITGISQGMSMTGMENRIGMTGISTNFGLTGMSSGFNLTGMSDSMSITGSNTDMRVTGMSDGLNVTGMANSINVTGMNTNVGVTGLNTNIGVTGASVGVDVTGDTTSISVTGSSTRINVIGSSTDITLAGQTTSITLSGVSNNISLWGAGVQCQEKVAQLEAVLSGLSTDLVGALKIVL